MEASDGPGADPNWEGTSPPAGTEGTTDPQPAAQGVKRARGGKPKAPPPEAFVKFMSHPKFKELIEGAHKEHKFFHNQESVDMYIRAVADPTGSVPMGVCMALLASDTYRFMLDPTVPKSLKPVVLLEFNGVRWLDHADSTVSDLELFTRTAVRKITQYLKDHVKEDDEEDDEEDDAEDEDMPDAAQPAPAGDAPPGDAPPAVTAAQVREKLMCMLQHLDRDAYLRKAKSAMLSHMKTSEFYKHLDKPPVEEFFHHLDMNANVIGFNNGVMNLREPDGSFKFYKKGEISPNQFPVSLSTQYDYEGPDVWKPNEPPNFTPEQKAAVEAMEKKTMKLFFFKQAMFVAATLAMGCMLFGGNMAKKLLMILGELGNNGKSMLIYIIKQVLGDYAGTLSKSALIETKREDDPGAANPHWVRLYKLRAIFVTEGKKTDKLDRSAVTTTTGGDAVPMRPLYGKPFDAVIMAMILWVSNFSPALDGADNALSNRPYPLSCDAEFKAGATADPDKGVWPAGNKTHMEAQLKAKRPILALLFLSYARRFADGGYELPPAPTGSATVALKAAATFDNLENWFNDNYDSTYTTTSPFRINWDKYGAEACTGLTNIMHEYELYTGVKISGKNAIAALNRINFKVGRIISKKYGVDINQGVPARRKERQEVDQGPPHVGEGSAAAAASPLAPPAGDQAEQAMMDMALVATAE